jgi:transposase
MKLVLQAKERERLLQALQRVGDVRLYRRLQAVWLAGEGLSATRIAELIGASVRSVKYWCARWRRGRRRHDPAEVLAEQPRLGAPPAFAELTTERLLDELSQDPLALGYAAANWTVPLLARHLQKQWQIAISPRTLRRRLHAAGLRWKRPRYVFAAPAEHLPQKKGRSCGC